MAKITQCPSILHISSINASVECRYVGTEVAVSKHVDKGAHQSIVDSTGANFRYAVLWWTASNGG